MDLLRCPLVIEQLLLHPLVLKPQLLHFILRALDLGHRQLAFRLQCSNQFTFLLKPGLEFSMLSRQSLVLLVEPWDVLSVGRLAIYLRADSCVAHILRLKHG